MKVRCYDIEWDTDGEETNLPTECVIETNIKEEDLQYELADELTDEFDWCICGLKYEILKL